MDSRMNKYYEETDERIPTRYHKNEELYKEISKSELNSFEVKSNSTIIGDNAASIDVEKIKKILDTKYNEIPARKSLRLEEEKTPEEKLDDTKEYDINVILEKAKEQKVENYDEERLKKIHDTGFDILKKLNIESKPELKDRSVDDFEEDNLKELINTIALNEKDAKNNLSLDILCDLKGDENTEVFEGLKEEVQENMQEEEKENETEEIENSFYTSSNAIKNKDLEDTDDFAQSIESNNTFLKVVIAIIVIIFLVGLGLLIKTLYFS